MRPLTLFLLSIFIAPALASADTALTPHIVVNGTAETLVRPDTLRWSLQVQHLGESLSAVADIHNQAVADVIDKIEESDVDEDDIQTSRMQFGENWEYVDSSRVRKGYSASTSVTFDIKDVDAYATLWQQFSEIRGVSVSRVSYDHSDRTELRHQARLDALKAARTKAADMAGALGADIGNPLVIEDEPSQSYSPLANTVGFADAEAMSRQRDNGIAVGQIAIRSRVRVTFALANPD